MTRVLITGMAVGALLLKPSPAPVQREKPLTENKRSRRRSSTWRIQGYEVRPERQRVRAAGCGPEPRGKWGANESKIKTAKDFIEKAASASSTTGKAYLIRFKDGKEVKSGDFLRAQLEKLEKVPGDKRDP